MNESSEEELIKQKEEEEEKKFRKELEKNWGFFRKYLSAEIEYALYCNSENPTDIGKDLLKGYVESAYDKFMVAFGVRKPPKIEDN